MRLAILVNPRAQGGQTGRLWPSYCQAISRHLGPARVLFSAGVGHAEQMSRAFAQEGPGRLVVLGGDGTLNEVVNGLYAPDGSTFYGSKTVLIPYPAGTGQDFARSIGVSQQRSASEPLFLGATERLVDVGRVLLMGRQGERKVRHFINIASAGMSADIVERVARHRWRFGRRTVFLGKTLEALWHASKRRIRLALDDGPPESVSINTIVMANGLSFGGGMKIAPRALLDDGLLDVVILHQMSLGKFVRHARGLYRGEHLALAQIKTARAGRICLTDEPESLTAFGPTAVELDGELPGYLPASFEVLPQQVWIWAPWHRGGAACMNTTAS